MPPPVPNIQQAVDNRIFSALQEDYGNQAPGDNWIEDPSENKKNKYAILREYRTLNPADVAAMVKGRTNASNAGAVLITSTRVIYNPQDLLGRVYGFQTQTLIYCTMPNFRGQQLGGARPAYEAVSDVSASIMRAPLNFAGLSIPFQLQVSEAEFTVDEMDMIRIMAIIQAGPLTRMP